MAPAAPITPPGQRGAPTEGGRIPDGDYDILPGGERACAWPPLPRSPLPASAAPLQKAARIPDGDYDILLSSHCIMLRILLSWA